MRWILSLIIALFLSVSGYCEILPDGTKFNLYNDFTGGLNTRDPPHKLAVDESPYIRNCYIDEGEIDPVNGTTILGSTPTLAKVNLLKRYVKSNGTIEYIVSDSSIVLVTQDFTVYTLLKSGLNNSYKLRAKQVEDKMYFTNGSNSPFIYNGTTVVVLDGGTYGAPTYKTPSMPKFKYIEYYQNRLWGFNLPDNPSALRWSLLQSTDVVPTAYAPDNELAWSNSNLQINIDKGNGTVGTFLRVYAGQLFAGKERGIHYIYGNDDTNYSAVPIVKDYGFLSDESVVEQDNVLLGYGNDGIYEFNGQQMIRISDKIFPDIQNFSFGVQKDITLSWDSQSDFARGNFSGSTTTGSGYIVYRPTIPINMFNAEGISQTSFTTLTYNINPNTEYIKASTIIFSEVVDGLYYKPYWARVAVQYNGSGASVIKFKNLNSDGVCESTGTISSGYDIYSTYNCDTSFVISGAEIKGGTLAIRQEFIGTSGDIVTASANIKAHSEIIFITTSAQQYISDIATTTNLSAWSLFNSINSAGGGSINFYIRTATSPVNIATYPYTSISPGSIIGSSITNTYIQWAATITGTNANIDNVQIIYQTGGSADVNPFGISWKNRYYLCVTTTSDGNTSLIYVKSRGGTKNPYGWSVLEGINTKTFLATSDIWYAGASTSGLIMRLDYGTNYNGSPITQIYKTNENNYKSPFLNKRILEYGIDCDEVASSTFTLSTSIDRGNYSDQQINNSGTGRMIRRLSYPSSKGNSFQWKFTNNQLDKPMRIYNWVTYFKEDATRTNTP
jgi:hypothetical protein